VTFAQKKELPPIVEEESKVKNKKVKSTSSKTKPKEEQEIPLTTGAMKKA
jgi:hypothetical protein